MIKINPNIFKAYDVRGVYPKELNKKSAELVGKAFVRFLRKGNQQKKLKIVVGRDNRASSPALFSSLKKGILMEGADLIDIGLSSSPMFYFAVWNYGFDGGIIITASHNPPQYNGLKIVSKGAKMIGSNTGLDKIKKLVFQIEKEKKPSSSRLGQIKKKNVLKDYLKFNLRAADIKKIKNLKIVIDTGNAVSGILIRELKKYLPSGIYHLFAKLDSSFPNHLPNPLEEKNIKDLKKLVRQRKADLGVAFDGDGDRVVFVNELGKVIPPDFITCLISEIILKKSKREKIIYTICSSNIIKEVVKKNNGKAIAWKVGHTFIKEKMRKEKAIFGGEYSGHFFLKSHNFCEVPLFIIFKILEKISESKKSISELTEAYEKYHYSGIVNLEVKDKKRRLKELEKKYKGGKITHLDGLRIDFKDWWFSARPSNTENLLRICVEAKTKSLMKEKLNKIKNPAP